MIFRVLLIKKIIESDMIQFRTVFYNAFVKKDIINYKIFLSLIMHRYLLFVSYFGMVNGEIWNL